MFKINSEDELLQLLKIVSQEAVDKSRKTLFEAVDTAQERYISNLRASESKYGVDLSEQEEEPEPDQEVTAEKEPTAEPEEETQKSSIDSETLGVSFDTVIKDINTLRAGRSTKDKEIKDELLGYYDRLDDSERKVLHLFLSEISKILQGALDASDAQDPSEPPFNAEISFGEDEETIPDSANTETSSETNDTEEDAGEDSSPPIKVNESQDLREIRKRVQRLMKRF
tara:strand:+ start:17418 stop:18098 length:681 start_codon:yes stop_codon:yes gene_type:complete